MEVGRPRLDDHLLQAEYSGPVSQGLAFLQLTFLLADSKAGSEAGSESGSEVGSRVLEGEGLELVGVGWEEAVV